MVAHAGRPCSQHWCHDPSVADLMGIQESLTYSKRGLPHQHGPGAIHEGAPAVAGDHEVRLLVSMCHECAQQLVAARMYINGDPVITTTWITSQQVTEASWDARREARHDSGG